MSSFVYQWDTIPFSPYRLQVLGIDPLFITLNIKWTHSREIKNAVPRSDHT